MIPAVVVLALGAVLAVAVHPILLPITCLAALLWWAEVESR